MSTTVNTAIERVCERLRTTGQEPLMRFLRELYLRERMPAAEVASNLRDAATDCGLIEWNGHVRLTDAGFLVGNVAKEYCNWIDAGRTMPPPVPPRELYAGKDVLDLGCSYGRWLWEFQEHARSIEGVELQPEYIALGSALAQHEGIKPPPIEQGSAEDVHLLVDEASKDFVFCRLVMNHLRVKSTLRKIADVLRPGGIAWLQVESYHAALESLRSKRLMTKAFGMFGLANSLLFATTGRQASLSVRGRMHARHKPVFPGVASWRSACLGAGFVDFRQVPTQPGTYVFCVRKAG